MKQLTPEEYQKSSFLLTQGTCHVVGDHSGRLVEFRHPHGHHNCAVCEGHIRAAVKFLEPEEKESK